MQFEFLVMAEKNIFVYKPFLSLNISDFSLFLCKNCNRPPLSKRSPPLFPSHPPTKFGDRFNPPAEIGGAHYEKATKTNLSCHQKFGLLFL